MNSSRTYSLELITPCFCAGARPGEEAEIRGASIRGQLRWWFRVLGGFKSLAPQAVWEQENRVFGVVNRQEASAGDLTVRAHGQQPLRSQAVRNAETMNARPGSDRGYLLHPLQDQSRAGFDGLRLPRFDLDILWRGEASLWEDIQALMAVFGHLGALGFRSRRAMGALAFNGPAPNLVDALNRFQSPQNLIVRKLPARDAGHAISVLAGWLRKWRAYTRQAANARHGESFAKKDHDAGLNMYNGPVFRPALGLPIIQTYSRSNRVVEWQESWNQRDQAGGGRFASPVLLRPGRLSPTQFHALVIFVESQQWPDTKKVYQDGRPRMVSRQLYDAMKNDPDLKPW